MVSRRNLLKAIGVSSLAGVTGCLQGGGGASGPIKIGFNAPLTGFASADGQQAEQGAKLAEQLINDDDGVNGREIQVLVEDDAASSDESVPIAKEFINNQNVHFGVSGSYSTPTRAISSIYNENGVPFISGYATHPDITNGEYTFRVGIWAPLHGKVAAKLAADDLDASKVAVLTIDNDFGQTITDSFMDEAPGRGLEVVYQTKYPLGETEFRSVLGNVQSNNPDMLFATGYYNEAANIVKQAEEIGLDIPIVGEEGYDSPKFFELGGQATEGTIISTNLNRDSDLDSTQSFISEYQSEWNEPPSMVAASSFDGIQLAAKAASETGGTDPDEIAEAINTLSNWTGAATGPIKEFIGPGEAVRPITMQEVQDQAWTEYVTYDDPDLIRPDF